MQIPIFISSIEILPRKIYHLTPGLSLFLTLIVLTFWGSNAGAVSPAPDGGYPGSNTAEGEDALFSLQSNHFGNTAVGYFALHDNATGNFNTAVGFSALQKTQSGTANTAVGNRALNSNTADNNTACGANAMDFNTGGFYNTAVGSTALLHNMVGSENTAVGSQALYGASGSSASYNTATGFQALYSITNGGGNLADGWQALFSNTSGTYNTATGTSALRQNTTGGYNTASGVNALYSNNGSNNTGFGAFSLQQNQNGEYNTAAGGNALYSNTDGLYNTATGYQALYANTHGSSNTAVGLNALVNSVDAGNNTAVGADALEDNLHGANNTAVGSTALGFATGSSNVAVGYQAGYNVKTGSSNILIGTNVLGNANDANVTRIGTTAQKKTFIGGIYNKTVASGVGVIINSSGQLGTVQSSARYKDDIKPMDKASEAILALKPVTFRYKEELDPDKIPQFGLIAEEVEKIDPDLVVRDDDGKVMTVRYDTVNAMLLNEFLKEHRKVKELEGVVARQGQEYTKKLSDQQRQIETLMSAVQKVSAQIGLSSAPPQLANNP